MSLRRSRRRRCRYCPQALRRTVRLPSCGPGGRGGTSAEVEEGQGGTRNRGGEGRVWSVSIYLPAVRYDGERVGVSLSRVGHGDERSRNNFSVPLCRVR